MKVIAALPAFSKCACDFHRRFNINQKGCEFWAGYTDFTCENCGYVDWTPAGHIMLYHGDIKDHLGNKSHIALFKFPPKICPSCAGLITTAIIPCGSLQMPTLFPNGENIVDMNRDGE